MEIKRLSFINEGEKEDSSALISVHGLKDGEGRKKIHSNPDRAEQNFSDYYTGKRVNGESKFVLNQEVFKLASRKDEIGILAQYCLQIERDSMAHDQEITSNMSIAASAHYTFESDVVKFSDFK